MQLPGNGLCGVFVVAGEQHGQQRGLASEDGIARVCRLHQPNHALNGAVLADLGSLHLKGAELVDRAAGHRVAHRLIHRQGFTGHDGLIDGGLAGENHAVHGDALAVEHADMIPNPDLFGGDDFLFDTAQLQQMLQLFHEGFHDRTSFLYTMGYGYIIPIGV